MSNYAQIIQNNLNTLFQQPDVCGRLMACLPADRDAAGVCFPAFGNVCHIGPKGVFLAGAPETGPVGVILSLYARHACMDAMLTTPFKAFKDLPNSMPYAAAFNTHTQNILIPHADRIQARLSEITGSMPAGAPPQDLDGDLVFLVRPLPKITLCYIVYHADEDFPASVTCLYSANADIFLPTDALADVGEYTSRKIIERLQS